MKILLHSGPGFISKLIRFQTRSAWNHASLLFDDGVVIEAREFKGVVKTPVSWVIGALNQEPRLRVAVYDFAEPLSAIAEDRARTWSESLVGAGYDYFDIARFISRRNSRDNDKWFCSELVAAAADLGNRPLFRETRPWEVSPGLIPRSLALQYRCELAALERSKIPHG